MKLPTRPLPADESRRRAPENAFFATRNDGERRLASTETYSSTSGKEYENVHFGEMKK